MSLFGKKRRQELRQYIFVVRELTDREIRRKYSRSKLGIVWSVLQPLMHMVVVSLVFSYMFSRDIDNYPVYFLCGHLIWDLFFASTNHAMTALVDNRLMLIRVKFPMRVFVISRVYTQFVNFLYTLIAFAAVVAVFRIHITWRIALFPAITAMALMFSLGMSYLLATAYVFFGDVKHLYGVLTTLWMYLSALFYPVTRLPAVVREVLGFNPVFLYINALRCVVMWGTLPPAQDFIRMAVAAVGFYALGRWVFERNRTRIMQML